MMDTDELWTVLLMMLEGMRWVVLVVVWKGVRWAVLLVMWESVRWAVLDAGEVVVVREMTQIVRDWQAEGVVLMQSSVLVLPCCLL